MSNPITIFGNTEQIAGGNLPTRIENLNDKVIITESVLSINPDDTVNVNPVSAYGKVLLDTTSLADLKAQILENTNEEAIRLLADGNNEINFYTGGTGASNLKMQIKNSSVDLLNNTPLNVNDLNVGLNKSLITDYVGSRAGENLRLRRGASVYQEYTSTGINMNENVVYATNKHLKQKVEDNNDRVLLESVTKRQYCLYSHEAGTNSGLLIQATANDVMKLNNYKNSASAYQPISINSTLASYLVTGADINPTIISANFVSNGVSLFCNGVNPILDIRSSSIKPYVSIIPNGINSEDLGNPANYFGNLHVYSANIKNDLFLDFFGSTDIKNDGFYFRSSYGSGSGNQDNMSIRGHNNSGANDGIAISAYGGVSINCGAITATNDNGNDAAINRVMLLDTNINNHRNMLPSSDGAVDIGSSSLKFAEIYGNNIRAHTSLYASQIRAYSGNNVHVHSSSITTDNGYSLAVDRVQSTGNNRDLFLGTGTTDKIILRNSTPIEIYDSVVIGSAPSGLIDLGTGVNPFGYVYTTSLSAAASVTAGDVEASVSITTRGNNSFISVEDDTYTNGKVQIISENSATYTGYMSFIKNDIRQMYLGYNNALQFENGSNFVIKSDQQNYLNFIHDATVSSRKMEVSCDLNPSSDQGADLGSATYRYAQIHGITLHAAIQLKANTITSYDANEIVEIDSVLRPSTNNTRTLGDGTKRWTEVFAINGTINTSDRNDKKDIEPIKNALSFVRKLEPVKYKWKDGGKRWHTGFISQDVLACNPLGLKDQWAGYVDTKNGLGLRYSEFISINTQSIKELDEKITKLQKTSVIIHEDGETKKDVNYTSELYERIETLEQQIEEMGDSICSNTIQNVIEIQSDDDRTELVEELERINMKNEKMEKTLNQNEVVIEELVNKITILENKIKEKQETDESEGGINMIEILQNRNYEMEQRINKLEKQNKKLTSNLNKLIKQLK